MPLASLPLATGGDDIPVVAFLLLAMVLAQRRRPFASGIVLGIASAMKFTAWPLALLALFAARNRKGERKPLTMLAGLLVVAIPTIFPFALRGPIALIDDVVLFPLGLSAIPSTAASALPGHELVLAFPALSRVLPVSVGFVLALVLARYLYKHTAQHRVAGVQHHRRRHVRAHPARAQPTRRLPAVPDQLLRLGLPVGATPRGSGALADRRH